MSLLAVDFLNTIFKEQKETSLSGKWIRFKDIESLFQKYESKFLVQEIGTSEKGMPIYKLKIGNGKKKYCCGRKCTEMKVRVQKHYSIYLIAF